MVPDSVCAILPNIMIDVDNSITSSLPNVTCTCSECSDEQLVHDKMWHPINVGYEVADDAAPGDQSGFSVSISRNGKRVAVGMRYSSVNGRRSGRVSVYDYHDSISEDIFLSDDESNNTGTVTEGLTEVGLMEEGLMEEGLIEEGLIEEESSLSADGYYWTLSGDILGESKGDETGFAISLSADGQRLAIGSVGNDENGVNSGQVRVYEFYPDGYDEANDDGKVNSTSTYWYPLDPPMVWPYESNAMFGLSVSLSEDGSRLAVGAPFYNNETGLVKIYEYHNSTVLTDGDAGGPFWIDLGSTIEGIEMNERCGWSVSLSNDGEILAIGSPFGSGAASVDDEESYSTGLVRVYELITTMSESDDDGIETNSWTQLGTDITGSELDFEFGHSVSLSHNGTILAVGAPGSQIEGIEDSEIVYGIVHVFENNEGNWTKLGQALQGEESDEAGFSVSLSEDGSIVAIGSPGYDVGIGEKEDTNNGRVDIYKLDVDNDGFPYWTLSNNPSSMVGDLTGQNFGYSVALAGDGQSVICGSPMLDIPEFSGQVNAYQSQHGSLQQEDTSLGDDDAIDLDDAADTFEDMSDELYSISVCGSSFNDAQKKCRKLPLCNTENIMEEMECYTRCDAGYEQFEPDACLRIGIDDVICHDFVCNPDDTVAPFD